MREKPDMPDRPDTWAFLIAWFQDHWPSFYAGLIGTGVAALRVAYGGGSWRQMLLEAPLCGLITVSACGGFELFSLSSTTAPFFGGIIGLLGVEGVRKLADRYLDRKVDLQ